MKRVASVGLILLLSLECFYKLGVITYFQLNRDYISEVLCIGRKQAVNVCNGQCFLRQNLDVADETSHDSGAVPTETQKIDLPIFLITETRYSTGDDGQPEHINSRYLIHSSSLPQPAPFHPPA